MFSILPLRGGRFCFCIDLSKGGITNVNGERRESSTFTDTIETETLKTTIGNKSDLGVGKGLVGVGEVKVEDVVGTGGGGLNQSGPFSISSGNFALRDGTSQDDLVGVVTTVVRGINNGLQDVTLGTKTDSDMVSVSRGARTLGLPTVTHVVTTTGQQDVGTGSVVLVGALNSTTAVTAESEINNGARKSKQKCYQLSCIDKLIFIKTYFLSSGQTGVTLP